MNVESQAFNIVIVKTSCMIFVENSLNFSKKECTCVILVFYFIKS